jgi:transposase
MLHGHFKRIRKRIRRKGDSNSMLYVGLDLHKRYSEFAVMDVGGNLLKQGRIENNSDEMNAFSQGLPASSSIAIESSSTWYWAHRLLSERHNVVLSNPVKNKAIASAKVKTDKIDSIMLATLLRGGFLAECYVPPREIIDFRELVRYRANLVRERTRIVTWFIGNNCLLLGRGLCFFEFR